MTVTIIARWETDHGPGWPYYPMMRASVLIQDGGKYYLRAEINAASKTWISKKEALAIMQERGILHHGKRYSQHEPHSSGIESI